MIRFSFSSSVLDASDLAEQIRKKLGAKEVKKVRILKKSIDARKKNDIRYVYTVAAETDNDKKYIGKDISFYEEKDFSLRLSVPQKTFEKRPVVVGSGPAGIFCALTLAYAGVRPIVIERGERVEDREKSIDEFFRTHILNTQSNVQFGEGGAGTFSDGKLNTNVHNGYIPTVLTEFVRHGAPEEILYVAKPHIGTDNLRSVVKSMREELLSLGGEIFYGVRLKDLRLAGGKLIGIETDIGSMDCDKLFLAIGHSARDTFEMLYAKGMKMESKIYSMGVRIEHLREDINRIQYGETAPFLPTADYKTATETNTGRSLYTFCMCPGGRVVNASSEEGGVCVNGMSYFARKDVNSNSALLVNVSREDWKSDHPLAGMAYQRKYERQTYNLFRNYKPVAQRLGDLMQGKESSRIGKIIPSVESGYNLGDLRACLPPCIVETLLQGVEIFGHRMKGFDHPDSILTGIEARSSSPVRLLRDENYCSSIEGVYPLGEGAGYAGGITSAAIDGIRGALTVLERT